MSAAGRGGLHTDTGVALDVSDAQLQAFIADDLGPERRDATSDALFDADATGRGRIVAREACVASGVDEACRVFRLLGADAVARVADGDRVDADAVIVDVAGPVRALLAAERTALNIMGRMSGIASATRRVQDIIADVSPTCRVAATRKTTPGFRVFEKRAVVHGGGDPHRYGLFDQVLVKDNHRAAWPDLASLIARVRAANPTLAIEVEVESLAEAETAARCGVDWILIDNLGPDETARIARHVRSLSAGVRIEASGGITAETAPAYAPHVDRVSMGAITQSARAVDLSLEWG